MARPKKNPDELSVLDSHRERTVRRNATEARQQFFVLLGEVIADPSEVVLIEHKDLPGRGMLVSEEYRAYVRHLEQLVKTLSNRLRPAGSFRLVGTMTLNEDLEDALRDVRAAEQSGVMKKFDNV